MNRWVLAFLVAAVLLWTAGCSTGSGAASVGHPLEREALDMLLWTTRGRDLGLLARAYCISGSSQERMWMREAYIAAGTPAKVVILCPKSEEH